MNAEHLVTMANQIGSFFETQGTYEEGVVSVADHLKKFWEPRMLKVIGEYVRSGGEGLHPAVAEAVKRAVPA
jgi:formate dehydrogenase subunit delta